MCLFCLMTAIPAHPLSHCMGLWAEHGRIPVGKGPGSPSTYPSLHFSTSRVHTWLPRVSPTPWGIPCFTSHPTGSHTLLPRPSAQLSPLTFSVDLLWESASPYSIGKPRAYQPFWKLFYCAAFLNRRHMVLSWKWVPFWEQPQSIVATPKWSLLLEWRHVASILYREADGRIDWLFFLKAISICIVYYIVSLNSISVYYISVYRLYLSAAIMHRIH